MQPRIGLSEAPQEIRCEVPFHSRDCCFVADAGQTSWLQGSRSRRSWLRLPRLRRMAGVCPCSPSSKYMKQGNSAVPRAGLTLFTIAMLWCLGTGADSAVCEFVLRPDSPTMLPGLASTRLLETAGTLHCWNHLPRWRLGVSSPGCGPGPCVTKLRRSSTGIITELMTRKSRKGYHVSGSIQVRSWVVVVAASRPGGYSRFKVQKPVLLWQVEGSS